MLNTPSPISQNVPLNKRHKTEANILRIKSILYLTK